MTNKHVSRRRLIGRGVCAISAVFGLSLVLNSCDDHSSPSPIEGKSEKQGGSEASCEDLSGVSKEEIEKRQSLGYVSKAPVPENVCGKCSMFIPAAAGKKCGGCLLFKGPVNAEGYCVQYVPKT